MANKIIIGIIGKHYNTDKRRTDTYIRDEIKQAIFDNGAIAIGILSPNDEIQYTTDDWQKYDNKINKYEIIEQVNLCDGIILQGGTTTEAYENWIAKYCYINDIPCLGICAGQNGIVRGLGGNTFEISNPEKHNQQYEEYVHSIKINKDSKIYNIIKKDEIMVNSRHKRSVNDCPYLDKVAFCDDNYPDIVESKNKKFYIGVRFHPESLYKIDNNMNNIFKEFIEQCKK